MVGGEQNYAKVIDCLLKLIYQKQNKQLFNDTLDTGSIEQVKFAVQAIASRAGIQTHLNK